MLSKYQKKQEHASNLILLTFEVQYQIKPGISPVIAKKILLLTPCLLLSRLCYNALPLTLTHPYKKKKKAGITMLWYTPTFLEMVLDQDWVAMGEGKWGELVAFWSVYESIVPVIIIQSFIGWVFLHLTQSFKFVNHTRGKGWVRELSKFRYHTNTFFSVLWPTNCFLFPPTSLLYKCKGHLPILKR